MSGSTPIGAADRELLNEVLALPVDQQRSRPVIARMRARGWTVGTICGLTGLTVDELMQVIREGAP